MVSNMKRSFCGFRDTSRSQALGTDIPVRRLACLISELFTQMLYSRSLNTHHSKAPWSQQFS